MGSELSLSTLYGETSSSGVPHVRTFCSSVQERGEHLRPRYVDPPRLSLSQTLSVSGWYGRVWRSIVHVQVVCLQSTYRPCIRNGTVLSSFRVIITSPMAGEYCLEYLSWGLSVDLCCPCSKRCYEENSRIMVNVDTCR